MEPLILLVAVLVCPVVMGTAMFLMWREMRRGGHARTPAQDSSPPPEQPQGDASMASQHKQADARRAS